MFSVLNGFYLPELANHISHMKVPKNNKFKHEILNKTSNCELAFPPTLIKNTCLS